MSQSGGSATIYGILYQAIGAAHWAATISLQADPLNSDFASATLVIEPAGGGGDLVVHGQRRIVEQWKAKSDRGTWSTRALITDVFPDLYRAIQLGETVPPIEYRFVSEGRAGRWEQMQQLFHRIRS